MKTKWLKHKIKYIGSAMLYFCSGGTPQKVRMSYEKINNYYKIAVILNKKFNITMDKFLYYLSEKINKFGENSKERNEIKKQWIQVFNSSPDDMKMFVYQMMYFTGIYDADITKLLVKYANETPISEYRYWLTMDLGVMTFRYQNAIYNGYFSQRKKLLKTIAEESDIKIPTISLSQREDVYQKICIVTYYLSPDELNSARRVAELMANGLARNGKDVYIVNLNAFMGSDGLITINPLEITLTQIKLINDKFDKNVKIDHMCDKNYRARFQNAIEKIYEYAPDIILDLTDEYSPIASIYNKDFCTIYKPFRSLGTSAYFYKVLIGGGKETYKELNEKYNFIDLNDVIEWNMPEYMPQRKKKINRSEITVNEDDYIIITIGNNDFYINDELSDCMAKLLNSENIVWLLVGRKAPKYIHEKYKKLIERKKIIEWGFEDDLLSLCDVCNISLRPDMKGGSGGTAIAAKAGLPIVMTKFVCDPMRWLGKDYTNNDNYNDCITEIKHLIHDKVYYDQQKNRTLECINSAIDSPEKWRELVKTLELIKGEYDER